MLRFRSSRDVANKFFISDQDEKGGEGIILRRLADGPVEYPGKGPVVELLDQFEMMGPNGTVGVLLPKRLDRGPSLGFCRPENPRMCQGSAWELLFICTP